MKFQVNIEFESLAEFIAFAAQLEPEEAKKPLKLVSSKKKSPKKSNIQPTMPGIKDYPIKGFWAPDGMIERLEKFIQSAKPFKTQDLVGEAILKNPHRRSKINKWLQGHPRLTFRYEKVDNNPGGRGALVYHPVQIKNGKILLPPGEKPQKSDWPIKAAGTRKMHTPIEVPADEEFSISDSLN